MDNEIKSISAQLVADNIVIDGKLDDAVWTQANVSQDFWNSLQDKPPSDQTEVLAIMDDVYSQLITVDFPDAITGGLRRTTDMLRGVVQRTRGDLTTAFRQEMMRQALEDFETRIGMET